MQYSFSSKGKYVDSEFEVYIQDLELHIVQRNVEHETGRTHEVGRVVMNADEFFMIYSELATDREDRFDTAAQYAVTLLNMFGKITLQSARELWRIATHQVDNFLVLTGDKSILFNVMAIDDPEEQLRLEENFGSSVVASCRRGKVKILKRGFK